MRLAKAKIGRERVQAICNTLVAHLFNIPESPEDYQIESVVMRAVTFLDHTFAEPREISKTSLLRSDAMLLVEYEALFKHEMQLRGLVLENHDEHFSVRRFPPADVACCCQCGAD